MKVCRSIGPEEDQYIIDVPNAIIRHYCLSTGYHYKPRLTPESGGNFHEEIENIEKIRFFGWVGRSVG